MREAVVIFVFAFLVASLWQRVRRLEERANKQVRRDEIDAQVFLRSMRDNHLHRLPQLHATHDNSGEAAEALASALSAERPSLQRVLIFSMWMSRDFVRTVAGITDAELEAIKEDRVAEVRVWPAPHMTIEEWDTHTVVVERSGSRTTIYRAEPWKGVDPHVIWRHRFGQPDGWRGTGGSLEIVLHNNAIMCWAREGRFKGKHWSGESEDQYLFITIPLESDKLKRFLRPDDDESVEAPYRYVSEPWDRQYDHETADTGWSLRIKDNLAYAQRGCQRGEQ